MGVRILENQKDGMAVLYDSVSETCFGPVIRDYSSEDGLEAFAGEVAEAFLEWLPGDPRQLTAREVMEQYARFMGEVERDGWPKVAEEVGA